MARAPAGGPPRVGEAAARLTRALRLAEPELRAERIADRWQALGPRAGILLAQPHPAHERDDARLDAFLGALHPAIPVAVELRHPTWHVEEVFRLLERRGAASCVMSSARLPCVARPDHRFASLRNRLRGPTTARGTRCGTRGG